MELTESYTSVLPPRILRRYEVVEVRNAGAILAATSPDELKDLIKVLSEFSLTESDIVEPGKNKSPVALLLDQRFRELGWREGRHDTEVLSRLRVMPYKDAGERGPRVVESVVINEGYKVDNVKGRVALDVEWNAKDGNLDRDLGAYRALYDSSVIDAAVIITRTQGDLKDLATTLGARKFGTTTTTNIDKLRPRLTRGSAGGCPVLAIAITARTYSRTGPSRSRSR